MSIPLFSAGPNLPVPPTRDSDLLAWAQHLSRVLQGLYRAIADALNRPYLIGTSETGGFTVADSYYALFVGTLRVKGNQTVRLQGTAELRGI